MTIFDELEAYYAQHLTPIGANMINPPICPKLKRNESLQSYLQRYADYLTEADAYQRLKAQ